MPSINNSAPKRRQWHSHWPDTKPSRRELAILRLLTDRGGLLVANYGGGLHFACGDGALTSCNGFRAIGSADFAKFVEVRWLLPDPGAPALFPDLAPAQRYVVGWRP